MNMLKIARCGILEKRKEQAAGRSKVALLLAAATIALSVTTAFATLPNGYAQYTYIKGDGSSARIVIDDYTPTPNSDKIEAVIEFPALDKETAVWCARGKYSTDAAWSLFALASGGLKLRFDYNTANSFVGSALSANTKYTVTADGPAFTWSGGTGTTVSKNDAFTDAGGPLALFAAYHNGIDNNNSYYGKHKLYSLKVWHSGELIHDLVPAVCELDSDSKKGLYDVAAKKFYVGSDSFTMGEAVAEQLEITSSHDGIGSPSPAYGVTNGLAAGESVAVSCGQASLTNAARLVAYTCTGWKLYDESGAVISNGVETSFTYTHPTPAAYRTLEWQWEEIRLPQPSLYDVTTLWAGTATNYSANAAGVAHAGFIAFDNKSKTDYNSCWSTTKSANMYVIYTFHDATPVDALGVYIGGTPARAPKSWTFEGSNDNSTWTTLDAQTDETDWSAYEFRYYKFANDTPYKYYKFNCTDNNGDASKMEIQELEFYYSQGTPSSGGEIDLTTSAAGSRCAESGTYAGYGAARAFNNGLNRSDSESRWLASKAANMYVTYMFNRATAVDAIGVYITGDANGSSRAPKDWTFSGSNDNSTWTTLDTRMDETGWKQAEFRYYKFVNDTPYKYYKFNCTANNGDANCMGIQELEFYHSQSGPGTANWRGCGETDLLTDAGNWNPSLPRWATTAYIDDTGATPAVVPEGEVVYSGLVVGNGSGNSAKLVQTNGTVRLLDSVLTIGRESGAGEYCISGGVLETKGVTGGDGVAIAEFDGGTLCAMAKNVSFLKDIPSVRLKDGGVTIDTEGYGLGITNCTFCVSSRGKITAVGGGKVTFTDVTITLAAGSSGAITFAERTDDGVFEGVPILNARGYKLRISDDNKSIRIIPPGFMLVVR